MRRTLCVLHTALLGIGLTGIRTPLSGQSCGAGQLSLQAGASLQLPSTFGIDGVVAGSDGGITLWSPGGEVLAVSPARQLSLSQIPDSISPVGLTPLVGGGFRVLDGLTGREFLIHPDGAVVATGVTLERWGEVFERAIWRDGGWVVGLLDLGARQFVLREYRSADRRTLFRSASADSVKAIPRFSLTDADAGVVLSRGTAPFTLYRVHLAGNRIDTLPPPLAGPGAGPIAADSLFLWRSASTVALDCVLLVTLTDLTSDRRLLVRYGPDDQVARVTALDAPLGLVTRIPGRPTVLGARRAGELELVWYDWRWIRASSSTGH